mmetsp:Transcript_18327/g.54309  ORF Transcript_18327/g.54309 Transcript_18327/m.54309 type:complete len:295 (-) Transcript_18327:179-1063(-)
MVLEALDLRPGDSFLNVGCGTGYLSSLGAHLMGPNSDSVGVEPRGGNVKFAAQAFKKALPEGAGHNLRLYKENIFNCDFENSMRFTKIYVGTQINQHQLRSLQRLLTPRGAIVAPVGNSFVKLERTSDSLLGEVEFLGGVMFAPIDGPVEPGITFVLEPPPKVWTPRAHRQMDLPSRFTEAVRTLMLIETRLRAPGHESRLWLPIECWLHIVSMLNRRWFYIPPPKPLPHLLKQTRHLWQGFTHLPGKVLREMFPEVSEKTLAYLECRSGELRQSLDQVVDDDDDASLAVRGGW